MSALAVSEEPWRLTGHGIKQVGGDRPDSVADFQVRPDARPPKPGRADNGAFIRLTEVLNSSSLHGSTRIGDLWPLIRPAYKFPLPSSGRIQLIPASVRAPDGLTANETIRVELSGLPGGLHYGTDSSPSGVRSDWDQETQALRDFLSHYPTLTSWIASTPEGQPIGIQLDSNGTASVAIHFEGLTDAASKDDVVRRFVYRDAGHECVYPSLDGGDRAVHPLVVWWAVLFGLSTLARYEPEEWARAIDVNRSPEAVPIEHLLQAGLDHLPELIHRTLVGQT